LTSLGNPPFRSLLPPISRHKRGGEQIHDTIKPYNARDEKFGEISATSPNQEAGTLVGFPCEAAWQRRKSDPGYLSTGVDGSLWDSNAA
jgi:hypothetical protein